ncbi:unnamed protein product [Caenorhabditis sp. 36 PRJEB53466]|nr:unnamed protein product [Caenorhabditis sp. 36 PRJEB53466]
MADPEVQKADDLRKFRECNWYFEQRETLRASRELCGIMGHESVGCNCFESNLEGIPPELPGFTIIQPDPKFNNEHGRTVASLFVSAAEPPAKKRKTQEKVKYSGEGTTKTRKPYAFKDRERESAEKRREIKKKLFMDLGIVRTNCGIDNEEKKREEAMKRKVTETIVTTYCELCEQNFSSSKMLLLHRSKVHDSSTLECHLCLKRFEQTLHFNRHMKTHYGPNAQYHVQCELCDRKFKDKESLKTHMEVSHETVTENKPL